MEILYIKKCEFKKKLSIHTNDLLSIIHRIKPNSSATNITYKGHGKFKTTKFNWTLCLI